MRMLKTLTCSTLAMCIAGTAFGQTAPTPRSVPFTEDFGTAGSATLPSGFAGWNGLSGNTVNSQALAEASTPTGNATISTVTPVATGGSYYFTAAGSNGRLAIVQSSNATNGVNQWILGINTTGQSGLSLTYNIIDQNSAPTRTLGVVAQYRVGNTGTWTTLPTVTGNPYVVVAGVVGTVTPVSIGLPPAIDNQPEVQIRWATWRGTEAGASAAYALDDVSVIAGGATTGACCNGGSCSVTTQAACTGVFQTLGSTCTPDPCVSFQIGACCVNGFCVGDLTQSACLANGAGSSWGGNGTACGSFTCPAAIGACCVGLVCSVTEQANCSGTWTLNGSCTPTNPCDPAAACCFASIGSCLIRPSVECGTLGGIYQGVGSVCSPSPCPPPAPGACCTGTTCATSPDPVTCFNGGGLFRGYGSTCTPNPCYVGNGTVITTFDFDTNIVGAPAANLTFATNPDRSATAGIFSNAFDVFGVVDRTTNGDIADNSASSADTIGILQAAETGKVFGVEDLLNPDNLAGTGNATFTFDIAGFTGINVAIDFAAFGNFEQLGSGAGSIDDSYVFTASIDGGTPQTLFASNIYEGILPTYTLESGTTNITTNDPCAINGSMVLNRFVTIAAPVTGSGSVLTLTFNAANDGGGEVFLFDNVVVRGNTGAATGACCTAGNNCSVTSSANCGLANGTYQGDNSSCTPSPCTPATGACCVGSTCSVSAQAACTGANSRYAGDGTVCNLVGNNTTPCCKADFNQSGAVTVQDIFDFLNAYFSSDASADVNGGGISVQDIFDFLNAYFTGC